MSIKWLIFPKFFNKSKENLAPQSKLAEQLILLKSNEIGSKDVILHNCKKKSL